MEYKPSTIRAYHYRAVKALLNEGFDKTCMFCGSRRKVECHHIDEDPCNNDPFNLIFLCRNHHKHLHDLQGRIL